MTEQDKAVVVRRMLQSGRELSEQQRLALHTLQKRVEQLWQQREGAQPGEATQPGESARRSSAAGSR
ncbi:MAG: hypothetical protein DIU80_002250 [Chloroflexota bacterium]|nr:MAG: hypothetical protein DIU80_02410 [Chloroflexota bacterium]